MASNPVEAFYADGRAIDWNKIIDVLLPILVAWLSKLIGLKK
jgi:hypothetical protein